jgi:hypothetical protein
MEGTARTPKGEFMSRVCLILPLLLAFAGCSPTRGEDKPTGIPGLNEIPRTEYQAQAAVDHLEALYQGKPQPESVRMFIAIVRGRIDSTTGWFGPAQTRYDWGWLARRCNTDPKGDISRAKFPGTDTWFASLDRNKDGTLGRADFKDREPTPFVESVTSPGTMMHCLFAGDLGSLQEGPAVADAAPDFELPTADGNGKVKLSTLIGKKPVVLVFGNYTCGSFRSLYKEIEEVKRKYGQEAEFLMVYVKEAHPTDGLRVEENVKAGVFVTQPRTDRDRTGVAQLCARALEPTMPLLVDGVDDTVGNAYSGMPERL